MHEDLQQKIKRHRRKLLGEHRYKRFAVLVPLLKDDREQWQVLFEVRSHNLRGQPGEICFPGGQLEHGDAGPREAAIRETVEELRIPRTAVEVWGSLDVVLTPSAPLVVFPFAGVLHTIERINPDPAEVDEVFMIPLETLRKIKPEYHEVEILARPPDDFPFEKIPGGRDYRWRKGTVPEYFYETHGRIIWGMTARILNNFLDVIAAGT